MNAEPEVSLSVVSHGQGGLVAALLDDLAKGADTSFEVILTLNLPEDERFIPRAPPFPLTVLRNSHRKGFGANHNAAFRVARGRHFAVVNPDVRLPKIELQALLGPLHAPVGLCAPLVRTACGRLEDSARRFPTLWRLFKRVALRQRQPDYVPETPIVDVDWVAGMFMVFDRHAFAHVEGFDERFHMYLEDTDICHRLRQAGYRVLWVTSTEVIHDARRASRRQLQHLRWHITSALRYLFLPCKKLHQP